MTYALILAQKPAHGWPETMFHAIHKMPADEGFEILIEGSWLVNLDTHLIFLSGVIEICRKANVVHRIAFFEQKPSFVFAPNDQA